MEITGETRHAPSAILQFQVSHLYCFWSGVCGIVVLESEESDSPEEGEIHLILGFYSSKHYWNVHIVISQQKKIGEIPSFSPFHTRYLLLTTHHPNLKRRETPCITHFINQNSETIH